MPGTFIGGSLAQGNLATTKTTLYTVPAVTVAFIKSLTLFNDNAAEQTVLLFLNTGGGSRKWRRFVLAQNESAKAIEPGGQIILKAADIIEAQTTTASAVPFTLTGVLET